MTVAPLAQGQLSVVAAHTVAKACGAPGGDRMLTLLQYNFKTILLKQYKC